MFYTIQNTREILTVGFEFSNVLSGALRYGPRVEPLWFPFLSRDI